MSLGPLVPADETFHHQITDTFATVGQSDRSWTEKVCAQAAARDGSVQVHLGMGKYPNRVGIRRLRVRADGSFRGRFVPAAAGTYRLYVVAKADRSTARGRSVGYRIVVRPRSGGGAVSG